MTVQSSKISFNISVFFARSLVIALGIVFSAGCGGGGGGGGGSDSSQGVRVLHAAIDAAPVDVSSSLSSSPVVTQQFFAGDKSYRSLSSGSQALSLTRHLNPSDVLASFTVDATSSSRYSILLYGDLQTFGLRTRLIEDEVPDDISGTVVRVVNGVTGATALTVAVSPGDTQEVGFGQNSEYITSTPGEVTVSGRRTADGLRVGSVSFTAEEGRAYTVLLAGEAAFYTKGVVFTDR